MAYQTRDELVTENERLQAALNRYESLLQNILTWRCFEGRGVGPAKENLYSLITSAQEDVIALLGEVANA